MRIISDFPGGNCKFISAEYDDKKIIINLEQEIRDTDPWWFYWCFKIEDAPEGEIEFAFHNKKVVCPHSAATSTDGINWTWCENFIDHTHFRYNFSENESRYFAFCIPYVLSDFERFYDTIKNDVKRTVLAKSEKGRDLPLLTFGNGKRNIIFTARHHCCESSGSYTLDGVVRAILKNHRSMLDDYKFHIIPFTDIDGAEEGDQGKNRIPHDHNRDYSESPIYNYTKAIYEYTKNMDIAVFFDFHSPWCWGGLDDEPHLHLGPSVEPTPDLQEKFSKILSDLTLSDNGDNIIFKNHVTYIGEPANKPDAKNSKNFFKYERNANISLCIETPYSGNLKNGYTVEQFYYWGGQIAEALYETLK